MILLSAFGANMNSGGEYVTKVVKNYLYENITLNEFIVVDSKRNNTDLTYLAHNKLLSIVVFIICPILYPQLTRRFNLQVLQKLRIHKHIVLNFTQTFIYSLFLKNQKKDLIIHDILLQVELRKKRYFLLPLIYIWEFIFFRVIKNVTLYTLSNKDKQLLMKYYFVKSEKVKVINLLELIAKDIKYDNRISSHQNLKNSGRRNTLLDYKSKNLTFGVIGAWKRSENFDGLKKLIKGINKNKINLIACGSNIERLHLINFNKIDVNFIGFVDDLNSFFNLIDVLIIPLDRGAGIKIKVLQSMLYGVPCIGTEVAFEGIDLNNNCIVFNNISGIINFLNNE